jgi:hypothetical protein
MYDECQYSSTDYQPMDQMEVSEILLHLLILNKLKVIYKHHLLQHSKACVLNLQFIYIYISHILRTHLAWYSVITGDDIPGIKVVRF